MNKEYYNCFSYKLNDFLKENNEPVVREMIHSVTGKTFWIYRINENLSYLLEKWSSG